MAKSLQAIEDYYQQKGLTGQGLRLALEQDPEYQSLLRQRKAEISQKYGIVANEENKYVLSREADYKILSKVKQLESMNINNVDRDLVRLIRTQLLDDWRTPLLQKLDELLQKYL